MEESKYNNTQKKIETQQNKIGQNETELKKHGNILFLKNYNYSCQPFASHSLGVPVMFLSSSLVINIMSRPFDFSAF